MTHKSILSIGFGILLLSACSNDPLDVDSSKIRVKLNYVNLDSIFYHVSSTELKKSIDATSLNENEILAYELGQCIGVGPLSESGTAARIKLFTFDQFINQIEEEIEVKFSNLSPQRTKITNGFKALKYHFPDGKIPQNIVFMNSLFASNAFATENEIGIGLERYLGPKSPVIKKVPDPIFQWIKDGMEAKFMERDVLTAWIMTHYIPESKGNTAEQMIRWGKILYLTEASLPNEDESIIMRYSKPDFEYAQKNEYAFWQFLVNEKMLFSEKERDHSNFLNEGPFTIGLPQESPDRMGQFIGWKMIHSYMIENPDTPLKDLIDLPYTEILQAYEIAE